MGLSGSLVCVVVCAPLLRLQIVVCLIFGKLADKNPARDENNCGKAFSEGRKGGGGGEVTVRKLSFRDEFKRMKNGGRRKMRRNIFEDRKTSYSRMSAGS